MNPQRRLVLGLLALALALGACTTPLTRVRIGTPPTRVPLAELCAAVLIDPEGAEGERALGELLRAWNARSRLAEPGPCGERVRIHAGDPGSFAPGYFDVLVPADGLEIDGLTRHRRAGAGVPLVGVRSNRLSAEIERHYPPEAIARAVTAWARREGDAQGPVVVRLLSPLYHESVGDDARGAPLAADFTAPFAVLLGRAGALRATGLTGFAREAPARSAQLYLMEPYDPRKTPLLMVHGLASTPLTWATLTNEIWGAAALRRRHQVWHYLYPTSAPFLYSALGLRRRLAEAFDSLAASGELPPPPLIVLAHSMGGLLAKTLITDSGESVWRTVFTVEPGALRGRPEDVEELRSILHWRADPRVARVIFVAVPHRGSELAARSVGRLGDSLAGVPPEFAALYERIDAENRAALAPALQRELATGELSSVDTLSPDHPILPVLGSLPFAAGVRVDSIIGNRGAAGPLAESSDGIVDYASSHLEGIPEVIVPTGHSGLGDPATIEAVKRLLAQP